MTGRIPAALAVVALLLAGCGGSEPDPLDTRSCDQLLRDFTAAEASVQRFDRGTPQFEAAEDAKWDAYDQSVALDCGDL